MTTHLCLIGDAGSIHLRRWAQEMVKRGFRVTVISTSAQQIDGTEVVALEPIRHAYDWFLRIPVLRNVVRALAPDIVHAHYITSYGMWGAASGRRPLVLTAWGSDILVTPGRSLFLKKLTGWTLRRASLITADSRDVLAAINSYRPCGNLREIFWGADTERFRPHEGLRTSGFHIASMRAWEPNYRVETIVRAFAQFFAVRPNSAPILHLFGGGSLASSLRGLVSQLGIAEKVIWHGWLGPTELAERLAACNLSITVPESDATSVSLLESMSCGLPVIVSDLPANRQWVSSEGGHIVPPGDVNALFKAICSEFDHASIRERRGAFNRARIEELGSTRRQMDRMAELYSALKKQKPTS
jgi:glycosyltransferase involved in cell wall biosynthesis